MVANRIENLLGDSESISRICREQPSLAKRIWERIKALIDTFGKSDTEREEIKKLRETERLFRAALETGGQDYIRGEMEETQRSGKTPVVEILDNAELNELIANSDRSKYDVIRNYLIQKFKGHTFTLSDGRKAIMDNSDAQKLARNANVTRTAQLGNLKSLIENAIYDNSEYNVEHKKFIDFHYYTVTAKYIGD